MTLRYTPRAAGPRAPRQAEPYVARLAMLRVQGAHVVAGPARAASNWLAGAALYLGVAAAGAVWIGGSLFDVRVAVSQALDRAATAAGFGARLTVAGIDGARAEEARTAALPTGLESLVFASPHEVRARLLGLDWVEDAVVQRHWPDRLTVHIKRRPTVYAAPFPTPAPAPSHGGAT